MTCDSVHSAGTSTARGQHRAWLEAMLHRNSRCRYLRAFGCPRTEADYLQRVPIVDYEDLSPLISELKSGESDVLFNGTPAAFERTGGSSGGSKLIPYSQDGLLDFQHELAPWLFRTIERHNISGSVYFSISPVARQNEKIRGLQVGLPDGAYLGAEAGAWLSQRNAVPAGVAEISDMDTWRQTTLNHLKAADDLELISVWSPTFLLGLFDGIADTQVHWPNLKVISCWASGSAKRYLSDVTSMFPHAIVEPKGLLSTEAVITVPDIEGRPRLVQHGYFEFRQAGHCYDASELVEKEEYEVILSTASGLYRYASGDTVRCDEASSHGNVALEFVGRDSMTSDLVGEKLTETFVNKCLEDVPGFAMLVPRMAPAGYVLVSDGIFSEGFVHKLDARLRRNPQYNYARRLRQLTPLNLLTCRTPHEVVEHVMRERGTRLGDIKPTSLRNEEFWLPLFMERTH